MTKKKLAIPLENGSLALDFISENLKFGQNYCHH